MTQEKLMVALRGPMTYDEAQVGDYVRLISKYDGNFGRIGKVLWVTSEQPRVIQIQLNPHGGGVKKQRPVNPGCYKIINELEVLAEAGL